MRFQNRVLLGDAAVLPVFLAPEGRAQTKTQAPAGKSAATPEATAHKKNMDAYIALIRRDISKRTEVMEHDGVERPGFGEI